MAYSNNLEPDELTALTSLDSGDVFVVGDTSDANEPAKHITKTNLITDLSSSFSVTGHNHTGVYAPVLGSDDNYVTDAEKAALHSHSNKTILDNTTASFITAQETKLGYISVTQAVNLDTMESDIATNNAKVTNATHTGEVTGSGALTVDKTAITGKTAVTAVGTDYVLISDTSDSGNLKKALVSDFGGGSGNVTKVGTPVDNQIGVWTGDGTIEGDTALTFDTSTDTLTIPNVIINTGIVPDANDGAYLGTSSLGFSDLFLAEGGVINWDNGDATLTQAGNVVTLAGADLTVPNMTVGASGAITLSENASIALDPAGSADGKYSGITVTGTGGATIAFGDLVTLDKDDSRWELVDISVAAAATGDARGILGMAVTSSSDGGALTVLLNGIIRADANFPALTIGAPVYASTTGDVVVTQPTTTDYVIRQVGYALTADELYFSPTGTWTTHT